MSNAGESEKFRVYIADLAAYNAGKLRGQWFTPSEFSDADEFMTAVQAFIKEAPHAEEWAIHDYENAHGLKIGEYANLGDVWETARLLSEHGEAYAAYVGHVGEKYATEEGFQESYCGSYSKGADYAEESARECSDAKVNFDVYPYTHIDWDAAWLELTHEGYYIHEGHVFRPL